MTNRSVIVELQARVGSYVSDFGKAKQSTDQLAQSQAKAGAATDRAAASTEKAGASAGKAAGGLSKLAESAEKNRDAWDKAGGALTAYGVSTVAVLGATAKAAMDWQSAWAGVTKTVDGSPQQMAELEDGLRGLAKTLPITHTEIAGVAEAAGQLGVARKDVLGFTKTMIDLGVSTNLTAEEAATDIAQISNVMGTMSREGAQGVARFGSALVALGNDGASTEKEILSMAQRIAGAGATVGATEVEVLALSNTLASMGIRAELGGGVTTRVLLKMFTAVKEGGSTLDSFAKTAGVSAAEFSKAYGESPVKALDMVAQGLNRVNEDGGNVVAVMKDLGIKGTEEIQVMLSLANSGTLLADSLALGSKAWEENTALIEEATKRYDTADSRVRIAWNNIKDAAISAGAVLLPVISTMADGVSDLASFFGDLPAPVQGALTVLGGLVGVSALLAGGFLVLFPRVMDVVGAFKTLGVSGGAVGGKMKSLGKALGFASIALAAASAITALHNASQPAAVSTGELSQALLGLKKNSGSLDDVFAGLKTEDSGRILANVNSVGEALDKLKNPGVYGSISSFGATVMGVDNDTAKLVNTLATMDQTLAGAVSSGNFEQASAGFKSIAESADEQGLSLEDVKAKFPTYLESLRELAGAAEVQVSEQELLNWAMGETPQVMLDAAAASEETATAIGEVGGEAEAAVVPLEDIVEALFALGMISMSSRDSTAAFHDALREMEAATLAAGDGSLGLGAVLNETATDFDLTTEAGSKANAAFQNIAAAGMADVEAKAREGMGQAELQANLQATYDALIVAANGMGIEGTAAEDLARKVMGIPPDADTNAYFHDAAAKLGIQSLTTDLNNLDGKTVNTYVRNQITTVLETLRTGDTSAPAAPAPGHGVRLPGGAFGGRLDEILGFHDGGRIPGSRSADARKDNVLGLVNGKPVGLMGTEWVINPRSSDAYDAELAAINEGSFPKGVLSGALSGGREWAAPAASISHIGAGAGTSTVSLHPEDRALLSAVASMADRPLVATWNGREVLTAVRKSEQAAKQGA